jgi:glucosamine 6-phosphate synthetase-like amidotransferase/phosphosugar isomerase protein
MCGIVAYFGGAGNHLTRILTGMSAIIYRAPDSTGIGLFGDDREPIRLRRSLGSVVQLLDVLRDETVYARPQARLQNVLDPNAGENELRRQQQRLLRFESFAAPPAEAQTAPPDFDALVNLETETPPRLSPGCAGEALFQREYRVRSRRDLSALIQTLITDFDLSPLVIQTLVRSALVETIGRRRRAGAVSASDEEIVAEFEDLFETTRAGARIKRLRRRKPPQFPKPPNVRKELWQCLMETVIRIPADYTRDAVCGLFRLLDAALISRIAGEPNLVEALDRVMDMMWLPSQRPHRVDWQILYAAEKGVNVYGWAAAAALTYLQREFFFPAVTEDTEHHTLMTSEAVVPGQTDPQLLRYLATPIIGHGRWAMQSAVTAANAHPFTDARRQRALALNGQFDSRVETRLRTFLENLGGYRLRSGNSAEYAVLLWGHFYDQLKTEQRRSDLVRQQVEQDMADIAIGSQSIDFSVYHRVRGRVSADLDQMAFIAAVQQVVQNGGQIAVIGVSLISPRRLYVASHNRPVFVVRRLANDDFMVVSDINAALGLFPQALVEETIIALDALTKRQAAAVAELNGQGASRSRLRACKVAFSRERDRLLEPFAVEVYPLDGEEIFALIETGLEAGTVRRTAAISDFDGHPLPDVEAFETCLDPITVRKDVDTSFHETHLAEVPERFRYILDVYSAESADVWPAIDLNHRILRRRFGRRLEGLRRLMLVGAGSAFHMAAIARTFLADLIPDIAIDVLRPSDIENPRRRFLNQQDLVVMLSWSSTTAEMVQLAQLLLKNNTLMIGITEKCFADMALAAGKSAGIMPIYSGEEVTIAGIKSTLCMLLCLHLLGMWIGAEKGKKERIEQTFKFMGHLAEGLERLNRDMGVITFSKQTAAALAGADSVVAVSAPEAVGIGREMALKLEEASWYAVGQWYAYDDILKTNPARWSPGRFVVVHATRRARIDAALAVMQQLAAAGIPFVVLTCPNRHLGRIERLSGQRCLVLPWGDAVSQPYIDIAFIYRLALDVGFACGHGAGVAPRNRTKSSTVTRSRSKAALSPAAELKRLAAHAPVTAAAGRGPGPARACRWEDAVTETRAAAALAELRRLADRLHREDALAALGVAAATDARKLGRLLFETRSEVNDLVMVALDAVACQVARDTTAFWRRLINMPMRVLPAGEWPRRVEDGTLVLIVATATDGVKMAGDAPSAENGPQIAWLGPAPPSWLDAGMTTAGRFILSAGANRCPPSWLYAGLNLLLARAWSQAAPQKALIVQRHITAAAASIAAVLNDAPLLEGLREVAAANAAYRTAIFLSPFAGSGRMWEERFDAAGRLLVVHHTLGQTGHGPIVTIDGNAAEKYVALEKRDRMMARYGAPDVVRWEAHCLAGGTVDDFLSRPSAMPLERPRAPFFSGNQWYLPVLQPGYDTRRDNLIILDMTAERHLPQVLDELSLLGSRVPRLVVITQEERIREAGKHTLFNYPISDVLVLPSPGGVPIADMHLPFVLNAVGVALASIWATTLEGMASADGASSRRIRAGERKPQGHTIP